MNQMNAACFIAAVGLQMISTRLSRIAAVSGSDPGQSSY
jgi:hypothetical protein